MHLGVTRLKSESIKNVAERINVYLQGEQKYTKFSLRTSADRYNWGHSADRYNCGHSVDRYY